VPAADVPQSALRRGIALIGGYARLHRRPFVFAITGATLFALMTVASSWALGRVVDRVINPRFTGVRPSNVRVVTWLALVVLVGVSRAAAVVFRRSNAGRWRNACEASIRGRVLDRLQEQPLAWHRRQTTGRLLAHAESDAEASCAILSPLPYSVGVVALLIIAPIWLVATDRPLGLIAVGLMPVIFGLNIVYQRRIAEPARRVQEQLGHLSAMAHEGVDGVALVKAMGAESVQLERFSSAAGQLRTAKMDQIRLRSTFDSVLDAVPAMVNISLVGLGAWRVQRGALTVGQVVGVVNLYTLLVWPLRMIGFALAELPRSLAGRERIDALLAEPVDAVPVPEVADGGIGVAARSLTYRHDDGRAAVDHVDLEIAAGTTVAIVGPTGAGKTTLLMVLAGLLHPDEGTVAHAPGRDGVVFQEAFLFSGTVATNVDAYDDAGAEGVRTALRQASADSFVENLPAGADTVIGERGATLSGGQRQRVALARALAARPSLLLLDDATSALDPTTEARILEVLRRELIGTTVVMIAARPSTIALADSVVYMENGQVVAHGPHAELLERYEGYRALVDAYLRDRAEAER
jgi:ATP-binding cassette subfamily B protein